MEKIPKILLMTVLFVLAFTVPADAGDIIRSYFDKDKSYCSEWREDNGFGWIKVLNTQTGRARVSAQTLAGVTIIPFSRNYSNITYITSDDHPDGGYFYVKRADNNREGAVDIHGREIMSLDKYESVLWYDGKYHAKRADTGEEECIAHPSGNSSNEPSNAPSNTYASTTSNSDNLTYHYTKSGRGQSQNTGQWTDAIGAEECEVTFGDDYITVNGVLESYVRTSGKWKVYGGTSMGWGGSSSTFYYYVDDYKNMMQVSELVMPYSMDTFVYPMSRNGDPTPQIGNTQSYGNSSTQGSSGTNSNNHNSGSSHNHGGYQDCHVCHGSGVCQTCNGRGYVTNYGRTSDCPNCYLQNMRRTGKCSRCQGRGKIYK